MVKTAEKKKFESRYGTIEIGKEHKWSNSESFQITPYFQELGLYAGQEDNFESASKNLSKYLRVSIGSSQIERLVKHYGCLLEEDIESDMANTTISLKETVSKLGEGTNAYGMMDGCMLLTRQKGEWREMKLGRLFTSEDLYEGVSKDRNWLKNSIYTAHFGDYESFLEKLEPLTDAYEKLGSRFIFVNDGAKWIWKWVSENYPKATQILDFFHAIEYLTEFAKVLFKEKQKRTDWVAQQKVLLLNDKVQKVIKNVEEISCPSQKKKDAQKKLLTYYGNNSQRMFYKTYKERGLLIGSGPIESAHRMVIQKRLKQSGQRWTKKGAQNVVNLRVAHKNGQWQNVIRLLDRAA